MASFQSQSDFSGWFVCSSTIPKVSRDVKFETDSNGNALFSKRHKNSSFRGSIPQKNALHCSIFKEVDQWLIKRHRYLTSEVIHHLDEGSVLRNYRLNAAGLGRTRIVAEI